jgi:urate oxidase
MPKEAFVKRFGDIYEHSPWIAERVWAGELSPANDTAIGLAAALAFQFRAASEEERLGVLVAHPDLAGKLAAAKRLTASSTDEQASAGLDALTDEERARFTDLNARYVAKFGFPFIIAVRDNTKASILAAFEKRIAHDRDAEFATACKQVERIGYLRLKALLPA